MTEKMNGHGDSVFVLIEEYYPKNESRQAVADIAIKSAGLVDRNQRAAYG